MQAWGASSKYQYRETNNFPTKSGIIGMIAAAMGIDKHCPNEEKFIAPLAELGFTAIHLPKKHSPTTRLMDFHTVGGGYDKNASLREKMSIPPKATGAPFGTVITRRSYLTDGSFAILLEGDKDTLHSIAKALTNPVWGIWFGRKTCLPATPLTPTHGESAQEGLDQLLQKLPDQNPIPLEQLEYQTDATMTQLGDGTFQQSDEPIAYGKHQGAIPTPYRSRTLCHHRPTN